MIVTMLDANEKPTRIIRVTNKKSGVTYHYGKEADTVNYIRSFPKGKGR